MYNKFATHSRDQDLSLSVDDAHTFVDVDTLGTEESHEKQLLLPVMNRAVEHERAEQCFYTLEDIYGHTIAK